MEYEDFVRAVGLKIKRLRLKKGITQEGMEEGQDGISYRTLQDIENGKAHASIRSLFKIARKLGVPVKNILDVE